MHALPSLALGMICLRDPASGDVDGDRFGSDGGSRALVSNMAQDDNDADEQICTGATH